MSEIVRLTEESMIVKLRPLENLLLLGLKLRIELGFTKTRNSVELLKG